jgi:hypothetical protein
VAGRRTRISRYVYRSQAPAGLGLIWGASREERVDEGTGVRRERAPRTPAQRLDAGRTGGAVLKGVSHRLCPAQPPSRLTVGAASVKLVTCHARCEWSIPARSIMSWISDKAPENTKAAKLVSPGHAFGSLAGAFPCSATVGAGVAPHSPWAAWSSGCSSSCQCLETLPFQQAQLSG